MNEAERVEYLTAQLQMYKASFALVVKSLFSSKNAEAQMEARATIEQKLHESFPQDIFTYIPPGCYGDGLQDAFHEIIAEFLKE